MEAHESEDDTEDFLSQFQLPPSSIKLDWATLLPPGGWKCPSDQHGDSNDIEDEWDWSDLKLSCGRGRDRYDLHSSSMASSDEGKATEHMPDKVLLRELGYSDSEDDDPEWTNRYLAPPSEPAYTAAAQPVELNRLYLSAPPSERLRKLVNNQMARFKHSGSSEYGSVLDNITPSSKELSREKISSPSLLRGRPSSEPIRKTCSHPPANFVISPSCPYFGLVPSHVEMELERRQARRAQREPRIDQDFMDELHDMWEERRKTRLMVEEFIHDVINSATQRLEAELQGVIQPQKVSGEALTTSTRVADKNNTRQAGSDSSENINVVGISQAQTSTVVSSKVAAMRQLLEQQIDKNPLLSGPSTTRRVVAISFSDIVNKDDANTAVKQASEKKGSKTVSPRIMKVMDQLSAETSKKTEVPPSGDTDTMKGAFRNLRKNVFERPTPEVKVQQTESDDRRTEKIPEDLSVADIRKQLEAKMAEEGDKALSCKKAPVSPRHHEEKKYAGDSTEPFPERKTYLNKKHEHDILEAKDANSSQSSSKTYHEGFQSTPLSKSSRSLPDTRSLTEKALSSPHPAISVPNTCGDDGSVRKTILKLEQDAGKKTDKKEDVVIPRRQASETSEMLLKLQTIDKSKKDVLRKRRLNVQAPEGLVRGTVDSLEKLHHQGDQGGGRGGGSAAQRSLDRAGNTMQMLSYSRNMVRLNVFQWLLETIYGLGMKIVAFVHNVLP
ncbi:uncharacterized protein LOC118430321 isoform X1 [Branchiostoma floridae]|uniref:Uncharacterized protein LOC118430321 isoform X1 n=1 Tax=Branchiostoma floridae TaxID=7739 RepID=A0A9J7M9U9_BRAFL|nr:uncharacterized protein LOC118430321 isoform X1 [Branchiostoma floridae]